jgi:hypothetical protein
MALEKSGLFSVRRAYRLALGTEREMCSMASHSGSTDGTRAIYKGIWSAKVPRKVKIFAWRLGHEGLATQLSRKTRKLEESGRCQICGAEDDSGHHAVIRCTKAVSAGS